MSNHVNVSERRKLLELNFHSVLVLFHPWERPSQFGVILGAAVLVGLALAKDAPLLSSAAVGASWTFALFLGACVRYGHDRLLLKPHGKPIRTSWSGAFVGSAVGVLLAGLIVLQGFSLINMLTLWAPATALAFTGCKLSCLRNGCCQWHPANQFHIPLQFLEFGFALAVALAVISITLTTNAELGAALFLCLHGTQRILSRAARSNATWKLSLPDAIPALLSGMTWISLMN